MFCTLAPIVLAERLGTPVIFAPQSVGPFGHERQRRCVQRALKGANLVLVREDVSYTFVQSLGVSPPTLRRAVDLWPAHFDPVLAKGGARGSP